MKTLISRTTSKGLLLVNISDGGTITAALNGVRISGNVAALPKPVPTAAGLAVATIAGNVALLAPEYEAIKEATHLFSVRLNLVASSDIGDAFPGSRAYTAARRVEEQLVAFDLAHPEILAGVRAEHDAEMASRYQD